MNVIATVLVLIILGTLITLVLLIRQFVKTRCCGCCKKVVSALESKLLFNSVLRACMETYLAMCIQMWYSVRYARVESGLESRINFLIVLLLLIYCLMAPFLARSFLFNQRDNIRRDPSYEARYGSLFLNVDKYKLQGLMFTAFFLIRRFLYAYIIVYLRSNIVLQVMALDVLSTTFLCYLITQMPMEDVTNNLVQIFNEIVLLIGT